MSLARIPSQNRRRVIWLGLTAVCLAAIVGCNDPAVNEILVLGLGEFLKAGIDALVVALLPRDTGSTPAAWIMDVTTGLLC